MCGIVGVVSQNQIGIKREDIACMIQEIKHRGPDGIDTALLGGGKAGFGHCRLSIIDLTQAASQPMQTLDKRYTIIYNGEVFNYKEIKDELKLLGYHFVSHSDTEVVLNAYAEWKEKALLRFNGMFALAIWDEKEQELFLARDRYGIKPLYYSMWKDRFLFASEQKAILKYPGFKKKLNLPIVKEYFTYQNILSQGTFFHNIFILEAGHYAVLKQGGKQLKPVCYWDYCFEEDHSLLSIEECAEELTYLFKKAIKRQLVSNVDIGTYLSGGMDSGSITAVAAGQISYIKSFTCGFDLHSASGIESTYDEREKAEYMSYLFKTEHYEMVLKAGDMERIMHDLVFHLEDPRVGQSYPNFYASKLASKFVKVVLSGIGGDELFGGYPWRYYRSVNNANFDEYVNKYYKFWQRMIPISMMEKLFAPVWNEVKGINGEIIFKEIFKTQDKNRVSPEQCVNHSLYFEAKTFLHGLLIVEDKISMAHSMETRVPFLDNDLVDFAMKLPVKYKLRNLKELVNLNENEPGGKGEKYYQKTNDGKILLRAAMNRILPNEILHANKQGFSAPDAAWFRGESIEYIRSIVMNSNSYIYQYLDRGTVQSIVKEHIDGKVNHRLFIWSLINFEEWCKIWS